MAESEMYGGMRRKRRPRERHPFHEKEFNRESYGGRVDMRRRIHDYQNRFDTRITPNNILKQPIILVKPNQNEVPYERTQSSSSPVEDTFDVNVKLKDKVQSSNTNDSVQSTTERFSSHHEQKHHSIKQDVQKFYSKNVKTNSDQVVTSKESNKPTEKSECDRPVKLLDEFLNWTDCGIELLEDQTHFLVIGILGQQGVGKSSIMSYLAGSDIKSKKLIFPCQTSNEVERASNMTVGVDMYVTEERTILLDSQPVLSPSLLEKCIYNDRKMSAEYSSPAAGIEMQSLQLATLFLSICHVVIVAQDWFTDSNLLSFLQIAEMLKLTSPASSTDSGNVETEFNEFYPHLIFLQTKSEHIHFDPPNLVAMTDTIANVLAHSKMLYKGSMSLSKSMLYPNLSICMPSSSEVNLFLVPKFLCAGKTDNSENDYTECGDSHFYQIPEYTSLPNQEHVLEVLRNMILSTRRLRLSRQTLTEKNWFYYAAKTWEAIKKSQMMAEFNRLLV